MCPGGVVVTTPTEQDALCINGMSHAARAGTFANSALVVTVDPSDYGSTNVYAGADFQAQCERLAYTLGGGAFVAPAQRLTDFLRDQPSSNLPKTSYRRGIESANLSEIYPAAVTEALRKAVEQFGKRMPGFVTQDASLIGVETRTSSPVRVVRGEDGQCAGIHGVYPAGEGMGYGGGIVSAAVDGMRCAENLLVRAGAQELQNAGA